MSCRSSWNHKSSLKQIKNKIADPDIKIISFDIFDTLIRRPVIQPKDIFFLINESVKQNFGVDFIAMRYGAEQELNDPFADIYDIWSYIGKKFELPEEIQDKLMQEEIIGESQMIYRRDAIWSIYQEAIKLNKRVIAVSDMYMPESILRTILDKCGYENIDKIYVSCDCHARKDSGELYSYVLQHEKAAANQVIHIGDNPQSDYRMAQKNGIKALYYPSSYDIAGHAKQGLKPVFKTEIISDDPMARILLGYMLNESFDDWTVLKKPLFDTAEQFAKIAIFPVLFHIAAYLLNNKEIQENYQTIYFVSRDGYLPLKAYSQLKSRSCGKKEGNYLYASRNAYQYIVYDTPYDRLRENKFSNAYTLKDYIDSIVFDEEIRNSIERKYSKEELALAVASNNAKCAELLSRPGELAEYYKQVKYAAKCYYRNVLHEHNQRILVFDCGYSGSISIALRKAFDNKTYVDKAYLWEYEKNSYRDEKNGTKTFLLVGGKKPSWCDPCFESCFSPTKGTCLGFRKNGNETEPIIEKITLSQACKNDMNLMQETALSMAERFADILGSYIKYFLVKDSRSLAMHTYRIIDGKSEKMLGALKNIVFTDSFMANTDCSLAHIICTQNYSLYSKRLKIQRAIRSGLKLLKKHL